MMERQMSDSQNWSERWRSVMNDRGYTDAGESSTNKFRISRLEIDAGRISASVIDSTTGRDKREYSVVVELPEWQDEQWQNVIELLGRQALYAAQLLAGEFPDELEILLREEGLALLPEENESIRVTCSSDAASSGAPNISRSYVAAVVQNAGEMLDEDPWLLLLLRGRRRQQVLRALRRMRGMNGDANGVSLVSSTPQILSSGGFQHLYNGQHEETTDSTEDASLEDGIDTFWGSSRVQEQFRPYIVQPLADLILLRRLGPPAFSHANAEVYDTLSDIYHRVGEAGLALAYAEDPPADDAISHADD